VGTPLRILAPFASCVVGIAAASMPEGMPPEGAHCALAAPPSDAGETLIVGVLVKTFPRRAEVPLSYTGCQTSWMRHGASWVPISVMYVEHRRLRLWWKPDRDDPSRGIVCRYAEGRLEPRAHAQCHEPPRTSVPSASYAPGCVQEALRTGRLTARCNATLDQML